MNRDRGRVGLRAWGRGGQRSSTGQDGSFDSIDRTLFLFFLTTQRTTTEGGWNRRICQIQSYIYDHSIRVCFRPVDTLDKIGIYPLFLNVTMVLSLE
jgi:hypothetical protein